MGSKGVRRPRGRPRLGAGRGRSMHPIANQGRGEGKGSGRVGRVRRLRRAHYPNQLLRPDFSVSISRVGNGVGEYK